MSDDIIPRRVRVLILGGGIHGVGVLHDLASRGWTDCHLIEKNFLGSGTSSRSTKLIHGGLRYLQRVSQFGLVYESLKERSFLMDVAKDIVKPLEFILPLADDSMASYYMTKIGLSLYDLLSFTHRIKPHRVIYQKEILEKAGILDPSKVKRGFSFWDGQTDDLALVQRIAACALELKASISQNTHAVKTVPCEQGYLTTVKLNDGSLKEISSLYVVNCLGPWANEYLKASNLVVPYKGINNKGAHILVRDLGLKSGVFLSTKDKKRIFFILPWKNKTLIGTTEDNFDGDLDNVSAKEEEINYLLNNVNEYLKDKLTLNDVELSFAGLRWLAAQDQQNLSATSRESIIGESSFGDKGLIYTLYGGKLTGYRAVAERICDLITKHSGNFIETKTLDKASWTFDPKNEKRFSLDERFYQGGK